MWDATPFASAATGRRGAPTGKHRGFAGRAESRGDALRHARRGFERAWPRGPQPIEDCAAGLVNDVGGQVGVAGARERRG